MVRLKELIIELSNNCNLSCTMCGFGQLEFDTKRFMKMDLFRRIINKIGSRSSTIRLNGRGESTIHPQFLAMLDYSKEICPTADLRLFTNLAFNDQKIIDSFIENNVQLFISIDSPVKKELEAIRRGCNYERIIRNMHGLRTMVARPFLVFTIQEANIHRIFDIGKFALENRFSIIYNTVRRDSGIELFEGMVQQNLKTIKHAFDDVGRLFKNSYLHCSYPGQIAGMNIYLEGAKETFGQKEHCPALASELCVLHNGDVTPCNMFNPYIYGNISDKSLEEILNGKPRDDFLKHHKTHFYCQNCACLGGFT